MDADVVSDAPTSCSKCGMALERVFDASQDAIDDMLREERSAISKIRRYLLVAGAAAAVSVALVVVNLAASLPAAAVVAIHWALLALSVPAVWYAGRSFLYQGYLSVVRRSLNMFSLISLGVLVVWFYSLFALIFNRFGGDLPVYFETSSAIIALALLGQYLEQKARQSTNTAVLRLLNLAPKTALLLKGGKDGGGEPTEVSVDDLSAGDVVLIRPNQTVPADGVILEGDSQIDESMVTGESVPAEKGAGARVIGGTLNGLGVLTVRLERTGAETLVQQIIREVERARLTTANYQRLVDRVSAVFTPLVILAAALALVLWAWVGADVLVGMLSAVSVLIIACPCALGLATPMSLTVAMRRAAANGMLFRSSVGLEQLAAVDTIVLDKTGTLTRGVPAVTRTATAAGVSERELLEVAAALEQSASHQFATAVTSYAKQQGVTAPAATKQDASSVGMGVTGEVGGVNVACGSVKYMAQLGVKVPSAHSAAEQADSAVHVARGGKWVGVFYLRDELRAAAADAARGLLNAKIDLVLATGDHQAVADQVAREVGISAVYAEQLPTDKAALVERLTAEQRKVAMVGDGINDAVALTVADVGIALSGGTDIAVESADLVLYGGQLDKISRAIHLSAQTIRNIKIGLIFAFGYNVILIPIAAGALFPVWGIPFSPILAAAAMSLSSVSVIANALRLNRTKI